MTTTVEPVYDHEPIRYSKLSVMTHQEKMRLRAAAFRAKKIYPKSVAELISRELLAWEDFGYRLGGDRLVNELVEHVMNEPLPKEAT